MYEVEIAFILNSTQEMRDKLKAIGAHLKKAYNKATIYYNLNSEVDESYRIKLYPDKFVADYKGGKMGDISREEKERLIENPEKEHERLMKNHKFNSIHVIKWKNELYDFNGIKLTLQPPCEGSFWDKPHIEIEKLVDSKDKEHAAQKEIKEFALKLGLKNQITRDLVMKQEQLKHDKIAKLPDFIELRKFVNSEYTFD